MTLHLGHHRSAQQQHDIREAKRELKNRIRTDWDYPPLPANQTPIRRRRSVDEVKEAEERIAGFRFHTPAHANAPARDEQSRRLGFEPLEWRERQYSSEDSEDEGSVATASSKGSKGSKKSTYRFEGPDSVGTQIEGRQAARKRKRQEQLDEEVEWNNGLAHWLSRRDAWTGAQTLQQVRMSEGIAGVDVGSTSGSASANSTPRTSTSTNSSRDSPVVSSPSTTPELDTERTVVNAIQPAPSSEVVVPLAPPLLVNHPIRKRITPDIYPEIYQKIILHSRTPSVPINLQTLINALVQGWKEDGEWPPKVGPVEKSIGRKRGAGHESALKSGVKAVGRVLRITGGESTVGGSKEKG